MLLQPEEKVSEPNQAEGRGKKIVPTEFPAIEKSKLSCFCPLFLKTSLFRLKTFRLQQKS
jgi:hypothetical protein